MIFYGNPGQNRTVRIDESRLPLIRRIIESSSMSRCVRKIK